VALHVVQNCQVRFGDTVAVFGLGAIGIFIAQWAKVIGAKQVFTFDVDEKKVLIANSLGLQGVLLTEQDSQIYIQERCSQGVDIAIDASGVGPSFSSGIACLRSSGTLGLVGRYIRPVENSPSLSEMILRKQLTIKGTWSFEFTHFPKHVWAMSLDALSRQLILTDPIISHQLPLNKTFHAIQSIMAHKEEPYFNILIKPQM
jgi:L-iditol 2-dehydrogenase